MFDPNLLMIAFGGIFIALWVAVRLGQWKKWYWKSRGGVYGYLPLGIIFLLYSVRDQAATWLGTAFNPVYISIFVVLCGCAVWFSLRPPAFIKPAWVRWVEAHPKQTVKLLGAAVEEEDDWEKHVASRAAVDEWVKAVVKKPPRKPKK